jgi:hypothetical protein
MSFVPRSSIGAPFVAGPQHDTREEIRHMY